MGKASIVLVNEGQCGAGKVNGKHFPSIEKWHRWPLEGPTINFASIIACQHWRNSSREQMKVLVTC